MNVRLITLFYLTVNVRASLHAPRLIIETLKLTIR